MVVILKITKMEQNHQNGAEKIDARVFAGDLYFYVVGVQKSF
jgi:hypothetical protein